MLPAMRPWTFLLLIIFVAGALIVGVSLLGGQPAEAVQVIKNSPPGYMLWVDPTTGCHYFVPDPYYGGVGNPLTPRMKANGSQLCMSVGN